MNTVRSIAFLLAFAVSGSVTAQYPDRPIKFIVPFAVSGLADIMARVVAQSVGGQSGKSVILENKGGAGGRIGYEIGAKSPPNGYTFVVTEVSYPMMPALYGTLAWDYDGLVPVTLVAHMPFAFTVSATAKLTTLSQLVALAKANPGKINYGSSGIGSGNHVVTELFMRASGTEMTHVPYKGMGEAMTGLLGGSIDLMITAMPTAMSNLKGGKIVVLAVTSAQRAEALPNVPTATEAGVALVASNWIGLTAPKGVPREAIDWMQKQVSSALRRPEVREHIATLGGDPQPMTSEEFGKLMQDENRRWGDIIRSAKIRAE